MGLESATYIDDLVTSNPAGTDQESQGDDHLRLIKAAAKNTFPNAARIFRFMDTKAAQTTTYTVSETADLHKLIVCDATSVGFTVNLPSTVIDGWWCLILKRDSTSNIITVDPAGSTTINGASTTSLSKQYQLALCWWDNQASVWVFAQIFPSTPYYSGAQDIPFSDISPSSTAKRILGAATATDFSEQTIAAVLEWLDAFSRGDLLARGASAFGRLAVGSANKLLQSDGTDPGWVTTFARVNYPSGASIQNTYSEYIFSSALSATIPADDTIPQVGEGSEVVSATITPRDTNSRIRITFNGQGYCQTASATGVMALFKDGAANAIYAKAIPGNNNTGTWVSNDWSFVFEHAPSTTSLITYSVRVGASSGNFFMNGTSSGRLLGGVSKAVLVVEEIAG